MERKSILMRLIRLISERDSVYHLRTNFKKVLPKTSPNYLQYKIHKR